MRREPVVHERKLWRLLRDRRLDGMKFRRQMVIGPYVVDFVCLGHRLIVEADGPFHDESRDAARDTWLTRQGFRVLRFPNAQIEQRDWEVVARIIETVKR
ncbi:endonuclease domain-containing protein [Brevundimonas variabilis]|uniref:Very-short-patch-repair endonuclease n=1 Tax=Brevundimonas variabilis TaxID=74312 RepID=A0A7W9FCX0_9CAUL|nr:endonuclease domain-containing protein [Brevundimonas variabilis]MBB5744851.1 very-short-patch-repair endonuclease [Brevundimonas variabilis]